jgi:arsenate reductase-like glutaredoxin family protein
MDKITTLEKRLKEVKEAFEAMKKNGISEEIMIPYIQMKTKLSRKDVKRMLSSIEEFYEDLISKETAKSI